MSYSRSITREHPSCLLFIVDQSSSMCESFAGTEINKAQAVAQIVNRLIDVLGLKCTTKDLVRHYFDIGIIKYGDQAVSQFTNELSEPAFSPINVLYENPLNLHEVIDSEADPIWIIPEADGLTAMNSAFKLAKNMLEAWVSRYPQSYPPTIFHISDGDYTDSDPSSLAEEIKTIETDDGGVLIYNINLTDTKKTGIIYPHTIDDLPSGDALRLFKMSGILPETIREKIYALKKLNLDPEARAFIYNADPTLLAQCLDIGTPLNMIGE
jgi:hypothetical protein